MSGCVMLPSGNAPPSVAPASHAVSPTPATTAAPVAPLSAASVNTL
jgi:hypothetical protein